MGDFSAYPRLRQVVTNVATGTSVTIGIAGPFHVTERADGSERAVGTGAWPWAGSLPVTHQRGLFVTEGRWVADGTTGTFTIVGHVVDLCPRLAA